jgi:voltage-dependent potassium channel beta subunit
MVESSSDKPKMQYRFLGNTGLKVSVIGYGNWLNSNDTSAAAFTKECIKACYDAGVNFFDTAEIYGEGEAERQMGAAFKELGLRREDLVVTTKIFKCGNGVNDRMGSRKHILEATDNSLERLQLDYVDVIYSHRPDYECSLEETCAAFHSVIEKGKAFYWGTSEWPAHRIIAAIGICEKNGWHKPIVEQPQYSMLVREKFENEYDHLFTKHGYGTTIWSPLCMGILTGKYNDGSIPDGSRFSGDNMKMVYERYFGEGKKEKTMATFKALADLAKENDCTMAQLALAWTIANKDVSVALCGFTKMAQFEDNLGALNVLAKWSDDLESKCDAILGNKP